MGTAIKHPVPDRVKPSFVRAECQSARMSKITNDGLTRSGTGCFIAVGLPIMATVGVKGLTSYRARTVIGLFLNTTLSGRSSYVFLPTTVWVATRPFFSHYSAPARQTRWMPNVRLRNKFSDFPCTEHAARDCASAAHLLEVK